MTAPYDGSTPTLMPGLRVKLAISGESLRRWYRLRRLWNELQSTAADATVASAELRGALEAAFDQAVDEAAEHAALLEANAAELNAVFAGDPQGDEPDAVRGYLGDPGTEAQTLAERLRALPAQRAGELEALDGTGDGQVLFELEGSAFCTIAAVVFADAYADCMNKVPGGCQHAEEVLNDLLTYCPIGGPSTSPS